MNGNRAAKLLIVTGAALLFVVRGAETSSLPAVVKNNLARTFDTRADAVILLDERTVEVSGDGRVTERVRIVQKLLTAYGVDAFCDPRIRFNERSQELEVLEASTYMLDGTKVVTGKNGLNPATPKELASFPAFADVQEMIVTHVGVEEGSITVLEYELRDKKPWRRFFYGKELFADEKDIEKKVLEIRLPAKSKLRWKAFNFTPKSPVEGGAAGTYRFEVQDVPGVNLHEGAGDPDMVLPCLQYSEGIDGKDLAAAVMSGASGFGGKGSPEEIDEILDLMRAEVEDEMPSPLDRTIHYYRRIADWLAGVEVDRREFGWSSRAPREAFSSGYADLYEKVGILWSVFSRLGYSPEAVLTLKRTVGEVKHHPDNIAGAWIKISAHGFYLYLPAGGSDTYGEPRPEEAFVLGPDGLRPAAFVKLATARFRVDLTVDLRKEPRRFSAVIKLRGKHNPYWKAFLSDGGAAAADIAGELIGQDALAVEKAYWRRLALSESVIVAEGAVNADGGEVDVSLDSTMLEKGFEELELWRQRRETPLLVREKEIESLALTVLLPEEGRAVYVPAAGKKKEGFSGSGLPGGGGGAGVKVMRKAGRGAGVVKAARTVVLHPGAVLPDEYGAFRKVLAGALSPNAERIIVELPGD